MLIEDLIIGLVVGGLFFAIMVYVIIRIMKRGPLRCARLISKERNVSIHSGMLVLLMADEYMTIADYIELCLNGDLTEERLVAYGNKLDEYRQRYGEGRACTEDYNSKIEIEIGNVVAYLRGGLPERLERIQSKGKDPKDYLERFVRNNISPETLGHVIDYKPAHEIREELNTLL